MTLQTTGGDQHYLLPASLLGYSVDKTFVHVRARVELINYPAALRWIFTRGTELTLTHLRSSLVDSVTPQRRMVSTSWTPNL